MSELMEASESDFERPRKRARVDSGEKTWAAASKDEIRLYEDSLPIVRVSSAEKSRDPDVTIFIGEIKKAYILPKNLITKHSTFFDRAFNGSFKEAGELKIHLEECTVETFDMTTQWMNTGSLVYKWPSSQTITALLHFMVFADYIDLLGPFDTVISEMKGMLRGSVAINAEHINIASQLPSGHPARNLVADACVKPYIISLQTGALWCPFVYEREMNEMEGFAADLIKAYTKAVVGTGQTRYVRDPLLGLTIY